MAKHTETGEHGVNQINRHHLHGHGKFLRAAKAVKPRKDRYEAPRVTRLGSVTELTQGKGQNAGPENGGGNSNT